MQPIFLVFVEESCELVWKNKWLADCWVGSVHIQNDDAWASFDVF